MRKKIVVGVVYLLMVAALPAASMLFEPAETAPASTYPETPPEQLALYDEATGGILLVDITEYLVGALACDIPYDYEPQALLAQAVAEHSYALWLSEQNRTDASLLGADLRVNTSAFEGYISEQQRVKLFGGEYRAAADAYLAAASEAAGYILTYAGEPAAACFHAVSCGTTESSADIFGTSFDYLVSVDSAWDKFSGSFAQQASVSPSQLSEALSALDEGFASAGEPSEWVGAVETTQNGTVTQIEVCGTFFSGVEFRQALSLRSANFTCAYADGEFVFATKGFGHGVGMSQYGANRMALDGATFDEILAHYYPSTTLSKQAA